MYKKGWGHLLTGDISNGLARGPARRSASPVGLIWAESHTCGFSETEGPLSKSAAPFLTGRHPLNAPARQRGADLAQLTCAVRASRGQVRLYPNSAVVVKDLRSGATAVAYKPEAALR
jgi:hypothetical protein